MPGQLYLAGRGEKNQMSCFLAGASILQTVFCRDAIYGVFTRLRLYQVASLPNCVSTARLLTQAHCYDRMAYRYDVGRIAEPP